MNLRKERKKGQNDRKEYCIMRGQHLAEDFVSSTPYVPSLPADLFHRQVNTFHLLPRSMSPSTLNA
jgi:hypothetical protein